jgi:membrane protein DedA with SNARE-associated domain
VSSIQETLLAYPEGLRYAGLSGMVFLASIGLFPGATLDIILYLIGVSVVKGVVEFFPSLLISILAVFAGETFVFELGKKVGPKVFQFRPIQKILKPEKIEALRLRLQASESKVMRSIRFVPAFRPHVLLCTSSIGLSRRVFYRLNSVLIITHVFLIIYGTTVIAHYIELTPIMVAGGIACMWVMNFFSR